MKYTVDEIAEMRGYIVSMGVSEWTIRYPREGGCYSAEQVESQIQTFMANETTPNELRIAAEKQAAKADAAVVAYKIDAARKKADAELDIAIKEQEARSAKSAWVAAQPAPPLNAPRKKWHDWYKLSERVS